MKKHILIIDDEESLLNSMKSNLRGLMDKYEVYTSSKSADILNLIENYAIDLLITDLLMPEKEGIELIQEVRKKYPLLRIIAMSGGGLIDRELCLDVALKLGASSCLEKPFTREELITKIEQEF